MKINEKILYKEFVDREYEIPRAPYIPELEFYSAVRSGDTKKVLVLCEKPLSEKEGLGTLSQDMLQNMKYHFVISAALITRYCIEGGMDVGTAFNLSDYYILSADQCFSIKELNSLHSSMCRDYTERMRTLNSPRGYSKPVALCIAYIYGNLHTRINLHALAEHAGLSVSYLSRLFKSETGMSVTEYIQYKKIETSKNMLRYSDYTVSEIAAVLAFPSHSYFTEIFRKRTGMTPLKYRAANYHKLDF